MKTNRLITRVERHVKRVLLGYGFTSGKTLVLAVSGGPDSLAMLYSMSHLRSELGLRLHGAHLDHGLRGAVSEADALFVADTFRSLGVYFTTGRVDVQSLQKDRRMSVEEAARDARYSFLARVAREQRADAIALGHTADDQAETVLMHIIRGSGLTGLRGMDTVSERTIEGRGVILFRPLLGATRQDTLGYCDALNLEPRMDRSNLSPAMTRNRIRMELLPMLEEYNPAIRDSLIRLSRNAAQNVAFLDNQIDSIWQDVVRQEGRKIELDKDHVQRLDPALRSHLLRRVVASVKGDLDGVEQGHIDDMARLLGGPTGAMLNLPGGVWFSVSYDGVTVASNDIEPCPLPPLDGEYALRFPGETLTGGWRITVSIEEQDGQPVGDFNNRELSSGPMRLSHTFPDGFTARFSCWVTDTRLTVRTRKPGDRFQPLGMSGWKKLQDFMVDAKIPRQWRDRVPLVVSPKGIAWVAGLRIADWACVKEGETRWIELRLAPENGWSP